MAHDRHEPPYQGGSQPVPEERPDVPGPGRGAAQYAVIALAVLVLLAVVAWLLGYLG